MAQSVGCGRHARRASRYKWSVRLPLPRTQIEKLGIRLVAESPPDPRDLDALHALLRVYGEVLGETVAVVRAETGLAPTARIKNTGTILEKLHRYGGSWLKSIQDLAGMRIVCDFDRNGQDALVADLVRLLDEKSRSPKVVDRRLAPVQGYRAVHVIAFPDGVPVEIQVRTRLQHEWAEIFEKLADLVGRGVRYGEPPAHWISEAERDQLAPPLRRIYETAYQWRQTSVDLALATADLVDAVERGEQEAPDDPDLGEFRGRVGRAIARLRDAVGQLEESMATTPPRP
jgi:hypothetical protein